MIFKFVSNDIIFILTAVETGDLNEIKHKKTSLSLISSEEKEIIEKIKEKRKKNQANALKKLIWVSLVCVIFLTIELVGSIYSKSTFLLSDALHLFSDFHGFAVSMFSIYLSSKPPSATYSYGFYRVEVLGAMVSIMSIWGITAFVVYRAIDKIVNNDFDIEGTLFLIIAVVGLGANLLMAQILHSSGGGHVSIIKLYYIRVMVLETVHMVMRMKLKKLMK